MRAILHPTDFTAESERVFLLACGIARDRSCEVIVLHVICPERCSADDRDGDDLDRDSALFQECWRRFCQFKDLAGRVPVSLQVKIGSPVETIIEVARKECCDLILIAGHNRPFLYRQMCGSISSSVADRSCCPVARLSPSPFHQELKSSLPATDLTNSTNRPLTQTSMKPHSCPVYSPVHPTGHRAPVPPHLRNSESEEILDARELI